MKSKKIVFHFIFCEKMTLFWTKLYYSEKCIFYFLISKKNKMFKHIFFFLKKTFLFWKYFLPDIIILPKSFSEKNKRFLGKLSFSSQHISASDIKVRCTYAPSPGTRRPAYTDGYHRLWSDQHLRYRTTSTVNHNDTE